MADPTKPSDSPNSPSPISPQIKVSPIGQQATPPSGGPAPVNLPTKEGMGPSPTPPSAPSMAQARPETPKITLTPPKAETPGAPVFKSSIRTMQEDITAIKKGQIPTGVQVEKQSEKDVTPPPAGAPGPKITMPPKPAPEIKLGELEKSKPLPGTKPSFPPPMPAVPPAGPMSKPAGLSVPTGGGINKKRLIFLTAGLIIVAFLVWFFALRGPSVPEVAISPTPTYTVTPTSTPVSIEDSFSIVDSASISLGADFITRFNNSINKELLISSREPALYKVLNPTSGNRYTLSEFLSGLLVQAPTELSAATNDSFFLSVIDKSDNVDGYGLLIELNDPVSALTAMGNWEGTMSQDLKDLFLLNLAKAATTTFLDNSYQGIAIRYRNFPDPNKTIDYAVVAAKNGKTFLVITNSREHMYSVIDKIK